MIKTMPCKHKLQYIKYFSLKESDWPKNFVAHAATGGSFDAPKELKALGYCGGADYGHKLAG